MKRATRYPTQTALRLRRGIFLPVFLWLISATTYAHDADTLAFYAFKERSPETAVNGVTVNNAVGAAYAGTVALGTSSENSILYKADVPGPYVFDSYGYGANVVCTNPQSLYFAGKATDGNQMLSFSGLATAISSNDDFSLCLQAYDQSSENNGNGKSYSKEFYEDGLLFDGRWHHFAVVYDDPTQTFKVYLDGKQKLANTIPTPFRPHTATQDRKYVVGDECNNSAFEGLVDEVRLVRRALDPSEFLKFRSSIAISFH